MKILLLGATGRTGREVIEAALKRGVKISAIARDPEKLKSFTIDITQGTPYDFATVEKAIVGCDAVINTLNVSRKSDNPWAPLTAPTDMISKSASNALGAMQKAGITRFVALSTIGAGRSWKSAPGILRFIVSMSNLKHAFSDHGKQEEMLQASGIDYTICRAPMLSAEKNGAKAIASEENETPAGFSLSRSSAAEFFLDIIEKREYVGKVICLANRRK